MSDDKLRWGVTVKDEDWNSLEEHLLTSEGLSKDYIELQEFKDKLMSGFNKDLDTYFKKLKIKGGFCYCDGGAQNVFFQDLRDWDSPQHFADTVNSLGSVLDTVYYPETKIVVVTFYELNISDTKFEKEEDFGQIDKVDVEFYEVTPGHLPYMIDVVRDEDELIEFMEKIKK